MIHNKTAQILAEEVVEIMTRLTALTLENETGIVTVTGNEIGIVTETEIVKETAIKTGIAIEIEMQAMVLMGGIVIRVQIEVMETAVSAGIADIVGTHHHTTSLTAVVHHLGTKIIHHPVPQNVRIMGMTLVKSLIVKGGASQSGISPMTNHLPLKRLLNLNLVACLLVQRAKIPKASLINLLRDSHPQHHSQVPHPFPTQAANLAGLLMCH